MEALKDKEEASEAVTRYAHLTAEYALLVATRDRAAQSLLETHDKVIAAKGGALREVEERLEEWAGKNRSEFGDEKSLEFSHGWLRYRQGQRKLEPLAKWTWAKVLKKLLSYKITSQWQEYVRRDPEVNKQKLLAETKEGGRLPAARLKEIGLKVTRDESFSIETKPDM